MTLPPEDRDLIARVLGFNADFVIKHMTRDHFAKLLAAALASRDAEIERLTAALGEAERAINRAKEAVEDQDDIELAEAKDAARRSDQHAQRVAVEAADGFAAMEALDEFWDAVGHPNNRGTLTPAEQVASICRELDQAAAALASRDAEIERLRGELRRAHLKRLVELSEEFGGYDELSTSALSALKTAREGNNA